MEQETKAHKLRMIAHEIKANVTVMENSLHGVINNPELKEEYLDNFEKGKARLLETAEKLKKENEEPNE